VLLNGWGCDRTWWDEAGFTRLLKPDFRVLNIDLRGHGQSDKPHQPSAYRAGHHTKDILAVADAESVDRFAIWGLSYGGWVGWLTAEAVPDRVAALVSSGYWSPFPQTEQEWREFDTTVGEALRQHGTRGLINLYREADGDAYDREYPPWAEAATLRADPQALLAAEGPEVDQGITTPLDRFPVPILLTAGEREDEQDQARAIASQLPQGQSIRLPALGHGAACAASELLVPHARAFLDRCFN
jgi:pimeloyl-ACP methyl ester carboxylesterase